MAILVGLTGGIGSGKSLAASFLGELGAKIIHADQISRKLVAPEKQAWKEIFEAFGANYFNYDKSLNREKIAAEIFQNHNKRNILEKIIHPRVLLEEQKLYNSYKNLNPDAVVVIDSALLIESGNYKNVDKVILVKCSVPLQIQRVIKRNKHTHEEIIKRHNAQLCLEEKIKYANYILINQGTIEELRSQVFVLYTKLKSLAQR